MQRYNSRTPKGKQEQGIVTKCSSRVAKSGSHAHSFFIGTQQYTLFMNDDLSPVTDGDRVRFEYETKTLRSKYHNKYNAIIPESLVIEAPVELSAEIEGLVYILSNPSMSGILKVGFTTSTAKKRAEELSRVTGIPTGFKVEWTLPILGNPKAVEQSAHAHLAKYRHGKEFFKVSLDIAKVACIESFVKLYPEQAILMEHSFSSRAENELKRRKDLEILAIQREADRQEQEKRKAYESSREGRWKYKGTCQIVLREFVEEPNRGSPSFLFKIFGAKYDDYIDFNIVVSQQKEAISWCITAKGRIQEKHIHEYKYFDTDGECLNYKDDIVKRHNVNNYKVVINIPNRFLEHPPELPADYFNPETTLTLKSMGELIVRPVISK